MQRTAYGLRLPAYFLKKIPGFLFLLLLCQGVVGQTVSLSLKNASLLQAFRAIESQVKQRFVYTREMVEAGKPVTVEEKNSSLPRVLQQVFESQPLDFSIDADFIIIRFKPLPVVPHAQSGMPLQGRVLNEEGEPIRGASVVVKGKKAATATGADGLFELPEVEPGDRLVVSSIGYTTKEVAVSGRLTIEVRLALAVSPLDETIVIAYGRTTRRFNTGAVSRVNGDMIGEQPVSNPLAALEGRVPGLSVVQTSGVPGSSFNLEIRGQSVLDKSLSRNDPLIVIDGMPFEAGNLPTNQLLSAANNPVSISQGGLSPLNTINAADIESVEVLKDADATAIYGSRGANGVVLITTRKAKRGKTSVTINSYKGWSKAVSRLSLLDTKQYLAMRREGFANEGQVPDASTAPDLVLWDTTRYTDFRKLLTGGTANVHAWQGSIAGGTNATNFLVCLHYRNEQNVFSDALNDVVSGGRLQLMHTSDNKKFVLQVTAAGSADQNRLVQTDLSRYLMLPPNLALYQANGQLAWEDAGVSYSSINSDFGNPLAQLHRRYSSENTNYMGSLFASYQVTKEVVVKLSAGYNQFSSDETAIRPSTSIDPATGLLPSSAFAQSVQQSVIAEPQLLWEHPIRKGRISFLVGSTFQTKRYRSQQTEGSNYATDLLLYTTRGAGTLSVTNNESEYRYTAGFSRLHVNLEDRYLFNLTARRDGSTRFAPERRFANFASIGGAWLLSSERWFHVSFVQLLKLRASYGTTGNDQIGDYRFLNLWTNSQQPYSGIPGLTPKSLYNPAYNWEANRKLEAALELGLFGDRMQFTLDYYRNRSSNQLVNYTLPAQTGFFSVVQNLPAKVENKGWELSVFSTILSKGAWKWTASLTLTVPKNELVSFPGLEASTYATQYREGYSLNSIYRLKATGVDRQTGVYTFEDVDKDGWWTEADYQYLGQLDPRFYGGFSSTLSYKTVSLSMLFAYRKQVGSNYLSQLSSMVPGTIYNQPVQVLDRWQKPGDEANVQKFSSDPWGSTYVGLSYLSLSNGIFSDASYLRLKNASFSYRIPDAWLRTAHLNGGKVFMEGQNLFTLTGYRGADPETQQVYVLPPLRTIAFGFEFTF